MVSVGGVAVEQDIGIVAIDHPPVNALSADVRRSLRDGILQLGGAASVQAIILICQGRTFFAGADIREFGTVVKPPFLDQVFEIIEASSKPVIAAIHGTALGGGYELALVCHYRIAVPSAKVGFPEVKLGLPPGGGGTQRLPRLIGVEAALDIMTSGTFVGAAKALELGMIDALAEEGRLREDAIAYARKIVAEGREPRLIRDRQDKVEAARGKPEIFVDFLNRHAAAFRGFLAPRAIAEAVQAAAELPFDEGYACEQRLSRELIASPQSAAQQYYFFAERAAAKSVGMEALLARGDGSIVDRLAASLRDQAARLVARGVDGHHINCLLYDYGFPADYITSGMEGELPAAVASEATIFQLLGAVVNEGAKLLDEGVGRRASDIDVAAILGCGWPVYIGGPMFWADRLGLGQIVAALAAMGLEPAPLLAAKAQAGQSLTAA